MPALLTARLEDDLAKQRARHLLRTLDARDGPQTTTITVDGRPLINFSSNDYLALAAHPALANAARNAIDRYGVGSGASALLSGRAAIHAELEQRLAQFLGREAALTFSSGYAANLGTLTALIGRHDRVFADRHNHASLIDGVRLSGARAVRYRHADVAQLDALLAAAPGLRWIVTDAVFSMDGDIAPLPALAALASTHDAALYVDDAHGIGVLGNEGRGTLAALSISPAQAPVLVGTLGKALGSAGAFVAGSQLLIDAVLQFARPYVYSTAPPPALAAAALAALDIVEREPARRARLHDNIAHFRAAAAARALPAPSVTPIQPIVVGAAPPALGLAAALRTRGYYLRAVRPPTVPAGTARLRISLCADHTHAQIDGLLDAIVELWPAA